MVQVNQPSKKAFTLIELSIVLVIIGLIVGGILVGKDLIKAAAMRAQVSQVEQIQTAIMTFKNKYNCIPGDCLNATNFFSNVSNGNGDGTVCQIYGVSGMACDTADTNRTVQWANANIMETSSVFDHLASSGLINLEPYDETASATAEPGIGYPIMKLQGSGENLAVAYGAANVGEVGGAVILHLKTYMYINQGHKLLLGACKNLAFFCGMKAEEAYQFDSKIDDGLPLTGKVTHASLRYIYRVPGDVNNEAGCTNWNTPLVNQYYISANNPYRGCVPLIDMPF